MRKVFAVILLALLVAGCKVGPDYHRPALAIPPSFAHLSSAAGAAAGRAPTARTGAASAGVCGRKGRQSAG